MNIPKHRVLLSLNRVKQPLKSDTVGRFLEKNGARTNGKKYNMVKQKKMLQIFLCCNSRGMAAAHEHSVGCRPGSSSAVTHSSVQPERTRWGRVAPPGSDVPGGKVKPLSVPP